jgi:hypothetical protein
MIPKIVLIATVLAGLVPAAPVRAHQPQASLEARVQAIAEDGPDALRQFIFRTRTIYALDFAAWVRPDRRDDRARLQADGAWSGVPSPEADIGAWIEAAGYPSPELHAGRD